MYNHYSNQSFTVNQQPVYSNSMRQGTAASKASLKIVGRQKPVRYLHIAERALAAAILFVLSPLFMLAGLLVRLESAGPVLLLVKYTDPGGNLLTLYRFRTTRKDERVIKYGKRQIVLKKATNKHRQTLTGKVITALGLAHLPGLLNVVQGHVTIAGLFSGKLVKAREACNTCKAPWMAPALFEVNSNINKQAI